MWPPAGEAEGSLDPRRTILTAKLERPQARDGQVPRTALVDRMLARDADAVVAVVAPPGYGKTTLLAEWASKQRRDVAWVSVDESDNDPSVLLAATATAVSRLSSVDSAVMDKMGAHASAVPTSVAALMSAFAPTASMTLVMDNIESVVNPESLDLIGELVWRLPSGSRLAYASRSPLPLPTPLLRSRQAVMEIGRDDLAMDRGESHQLLTATGAGLSADEMDALFEQTEGWPAGLYLAALTAQGRRSTAAGFAFSGDDVLMGDYLRTEILARLPASTVSFLTKSSVLDQMSGPLCDAVLGAHDSQQMLESLESSNLLLVPLDRRRTWYRYHRLFRDLLVTELARSDPALVPELHGRAARWLAEHRLPETAIRHAQQSADHDLAARLVAANVQPAYAAGRVTDVRAWLDWFRTEGLIQRYPHVAVFGALTAAFSGQPASAERWTAAAELAGGHRDHGAEFDGLLALLRAVLTRRGTTDMRADARFAQRTLGARSALRATALLLEALSHLLDGDDDAADPILAHAYDVAVDFQATAVSASAASFRAVIAVAYDEWDAAQLYSHRAVDILESGGHDEYIEAGVVYAVAARLAVHDGDAATAIGHLVRAARVRPLLTYAMPVSTLIQLEIVRAYLWVADPSGARTVLREIRDIIHQRPDLGMIAQHVDRLKHDLDAMRQSPVGASSLTTAELRLLPILATHLSFPEIGRRLHLSRHTIKTQAISIYRKLGVSSRSEAIDGARQVGLLTP